MYDKLIANQLTALSGVHVGPWIDLAPVILAVVVLFSINWIVDRDCQRRSAKAVIRASAIHPRRHIR